MQPTLTTSRLELRPAHAGDVDALWSLWTDAAVRRFLWDDRVITREEAADALADAMRVATGGLGLWMVTMTGDGEAIRSGARPTIGCAGLLPTTVAATFDVRVSGLVEPLVALAPAFWGNGYAGEALVALLGHASHTLGIARVAGVTDVPNVASDRMLRRAGFRVLGEVPGPTCALRTYLWESGAASEASVAAGSTMGNPRAELRP